MLMATRKRIKAVPSTSAMTRDTCACHLHTCMHPNQFDKEGPDTTNDMRLDSSVHTRTHIKYLELKYA